jgi:hypothetical protein
MSSEKLNNKKWADLDVEVTRPRVKDELVSKHNVNTPNLNTSTLRI